MEDEQAVATTSERGAGRPVAFMREEAIQAAMHLFWKQGLLAVSAKDLAKAMGVQRSSFYNSFGSREAVFVEALQRYSAQAPDVPLGNVAPDQPVVPLLVSVMREICRVRAADEQARGCLVCNSIAELVGVDESLGPLLAEAVVLRTGLVERLLLQAVRQKELAPADPAVTAKMFIAFLIGLNTISKVIRDEAQLWAMCREFLAGMGIAQEALETSGRSPHL